MAGLGNSCRARRAGTAFDALGIKQHQQGIALTAWERKVDVVGQAVRFIKDW
jgi:hypothetical protein